MPEWSDLTRISREHGRTDKSGLPIFGDTHWYTEFYGRILGPRRTNVRNVLEIGIGRGGSLLMWRDFFPNAVIHGIDGREDFMMSEDRIVTYNCNAYTEKCMNSYLADKRFDVIIDDGPHTPESWIFCLNNYVDLLDEGGILMIEDVIHKHVAEVYQSFKGDTKRLSLVDRRDCDGSSENELILLYM